MGKRPLVIAVRPAPLGWRSEAYPKPFPGVIGSAAAQIVAARINRRLGTRAVAAAAIDAPVTHNSCRTRDGAGVPE